MGLFKIAEVYSKAARAWEIKKSPIHGNGVFAGKNFISGEIIGLALRKLGDKRYIRTLLGHHINHQNKANSLLQKANKDEYSLVATKNISVGEEITTDYRIYERNMAYEDNVVL